MASAGYGAEVEGVHAVEAALAAGRVELLIVERARRDRLKALLIRAEAADVPVRMVDDVSELAETAAPQGVVARCRPIPFADLEDLIAEETPAGLVVLDHLEDPHNLGAVARSAVAAGIPRLVVARRRAAPVSAAAFKVAAGALEHVRIAAVSSVADTVRTLDREGVWTVGLDPRGDRPLFGLDLLAEPVALVLGAEVGLHRLVRERCQVLAAIPVLGPVESLNTSVAAALACYEVARVRKLA
jgi:23S rRNA (guanosine2251-2'-O)-methyltransferase